MLNNLKTIAEIKKIKENFKDKKIIFTNGCFDLLHIGHIRYLEQAKSLGDILIVGINSDSSVKKLKGKRRPLIPEKERAEILLALKSVDYVVIFPELTPENLLAELKPNIHVKGGDYKIVDLPERKIIQNYNGKIKIINFVANHSTSQIIQNILKKYQN